MGYEMSATTELMIQIAWWVHYGIPLMIFGMILVGGLVVFFGAYIKLLIRRRRR